MQAIATLINANSDLTAAQKWKALSESCDLSGIKIPQNPHFSWMVSERFEEESVRAAFAEIARKTSVFEISTNGLGIFTGEKPILYLPIVKTDVLMDLHKEIWHMLFSSGTNQNTVYQPAQWMPHITVVAEELTASKLSCLIESIISIPSEMTIHVNNLALIYSNQESAGIKFVQEFGKGAE